MEVRPHADGAKEGSSDASCVRGLAMAMGNLRERAGGYCGMSMGFNAFATEPAPWMLSVCMYACMFTYTHIQIHLFASIYIYIYMDILVDREAPFPAYKTHKKRVWKPAK